MQDGVVLRLSIETSTSEQLKWHQLIQPVMNLGCDYNTGNGTINSNMGYYSAHMYLYSPLKIKLLIRDK